MVLGKVAHKVILAAEGSRNLDGKAEGSDAGHHFLPTTVVYGPNSPQ